ncbi:MAG: repair protein RecO [Clostridiales bacterium]|jgi:DNA repair protein RecO (recombination protein O)|nr:repair protein RecO [Clostridiales bacterium]MDF2892002.1 repair protein RecO [Clostridia bacterium]
MAITKTQGIVLKYTNLGEADKILTILTRNKGKIKAVAKGCRKPKSSLLASSELFAFSEFVLYKGANLYQISQADTRETFYNLRNDLLKLSYAVFFVEMADAVSEEELSSERLFLLLAKTLYYLAEGEIPIGIINEAYQLKLMDISGYRPSLQRCVHCGKNEVKEYKFDIEMGGVICSECEKFGKNVIRISPGTLETIRILLNTEISRLNTLKIDNTIFNEIDRLVKRFVETHLDKHFKSLDFLNEIKNSKQ